MPINLTIPIPDELAPRVLDALAAHYSYDPTRSDGSPNPVTKRQHVTAGLKDYIRGIVISYEMAQAETNARTAAQAKGQNEVVL